MTHVEWMMAVRQIAQDSATPPLGRLALIENAIARQLAMPPLESLPATHVYLEDGLVYRIDALTLDQARLVIVRLIDDLEAERRQKGAGDGFRP